MGKVVLFKSRRVCLIEGVLEKATLYDLKHGVSVVQQGLTMVYSGHGLDSYDLPLILNEINRREKDR